MWHGRNYNARAYGHRGPNAVPLNTFELVTTVSSDSCNFLPERDYVTFWSLLSQIRLSSVTFVRPTQGVETFGNISSPFCTLAILWPPCKNFTEIVPGEPIRRRVKRKRGIKIERCHVLVSHLLMSLLLLFRQQRISPAKRPTTPPLRFCIGSKIWSYANGLRVSVFEFRLTANA